MKPKAFISNVPNTREEALKFSIKWFYSLNKCTKNYKHWPTIRYVSNWCCVECAKENAKKPESIARVKKAYAKLTHHEKMLSWAKYRHKRKGYPGIFDLTIENVEFPVVCPALGIKLKYESQSDKQADDAPTLDRIDSNLGYAKDNVRVISRKANRIKNNGTPEEIIKVANYVKQFLKT